MGEWEQNETDINPTLSIITLHVNELNNQKADTAGLDKKIQFYVVYKRHTLDSERSKLKVKQCKIVYHVNS